MSCTIQQSVESFHKDFLKKMQGHAKGIKINSKKSRVVISPNANTKIKTTQQAYKVAEGKLKALEKLSQEYFGFPGAFKTNGVQVSPDGQVFFDLTPPFNTYREILKKQEQVEALKKKAVETREEALEKIAQTEKELSEIDPKLVPEVVHVQEYASTKRQEVIDLFNYQEYLIDSGVEQSLLSGEELPDTFEGLENINFNLQSHEVPQFNEEGVTAKAQRDSMLSYTNQAVKYKEQQLKKLRNNRKLLIESFKGDAASAELKARYESSLLILQRLENQIRNDLRILRSQNKQAIIKTLEEELDSLEQQLEIPEDLNAFMDQFENFQVYERILFLSDMIPNGLLTSERTKAKLQNSEYGVFEGAFDMDFMPKSKRAEIANRVEKIREKYVKMMPQVIEAMAMNDPIFMANIKSGKITYEELKQYIEDQNFADTSWWQERLTSGIEGNSQIEEMLARTIYEGASLTERMSNQNYSTAFEIKWDNGIAALKALYPDLNLKELGVKLHRMFKNKKDFGRTLISKFSDAYRQDLNILKKFINEATYGTEAERLVAYRDFMHEINNTHIPIDPRKLPEIRQDAEFGNRQPFFDEVSDSEAEDYRNDLIGRLGIKEYERQVKLVYVKLRDYEIQEKNLKTIYDSDSRTAEAEVANVSPWVFSQNLARNLELAEVGADLDEHYYEDSTGTIIPILPTGRGNILYIPREDPRTSDITDPSSRFNSDFTEIESNPAFYEAWEATYEYYSEYINTRLGNRGDYLSALQKEAFSFRKAVKEMGLKNAMSAMFAEFVENVKSFGNERGKFQKERSTIKSEVNDFSNKQIALLQTSLRNTKSISELNKIIVEQGIVYDSKTFEDFRDELLNEPKSAGMSNKEVLREAQKRYKNHLAKAIATERVFSEYNTDFRLVTRTLGGMAAMDRARQESFPRVKQIREIMREKNRAFKQEINNATNTKTNRPRAEKRFDSWVESVIKNNPKGLRGVELSYNPDEMTPEQFQALKEAQELELQNENTYQFRLTGKGAINRKDWNIPRKIKYITNTEKEYFKFLNKLLEGKIESPDFDFDIYVNEQDKVTYSHRYSESKKTMVPIRTQNVARPDGTVKLETEEISEKEYRDALEVHYVDSQIALGTDKSGLGIYTDILRAFSMAALALKPVVGAMQRIEGKWSLQAEAIRRNREKENNNAEKFLSFYNAYRDNTHIKGKASLQQFKMLDEFIARAGIYQDKQSLIDRLTNDGEASALGDFLGMSINMPERKNQAQALLTNAQFVKILDEDGVEHSLFGPMSLYGPDGKALYDVIDGKKVARTNPRKLQFNIYKNANLELRDNFRNNPTGISNVEVWEKFGERLPNRGQENPVLALALSTTNDIITSLGNFSERDPLPLMDHPLGTLIMFFSRWAGARANKLFSNRVKLNPITGEKSRAGYYMLNKEGLGLIGIPLMLVGGATMFGAISLGTFLVGAPIVLVAGSMLANSTLVGGTKSLRTGAIGIGLGSALESLVRIADFPLKLTGATAGNSIATSGFYTNKVSLLEKARRSGEMTDEEVAKLKTLSHIVSTATSTVLWPLAIRIFMHLDMWEEIIAKIFSPEEDDDEEEKQRKRDRVAFMYKARETVGFGLENFSNQLRGTQVAELKPLTYIADRSNLISLSMTTNALKDVGELSGDSYNKFGTDFWGGLAGFGQLLGRGVPTKGLFDNYRFLRTGGVEGRLSIAQGRVYEPNTISNKAFKKYNQRSEEVVKELFDMNGKGLRDRVQVLMTKAIEDNDPVTVKKIFGNRSVPSTEMMQKTVADLTKFLTKQKQQDTYVQTAETALAGLKKLPFIVEEHPEIIQEVEEALKEAKKREAKENALKEGLTKEQQLNPFISGEDYKSTAKERGKLKQKVLDHFDNLQEIQSLPQVQE